MAISDWPLAERPRERLLAEGAEALSDAELLAVLLRTGLPGKSAVDLGRELVHAIQGRRRRAASRRATSARSRGLGPAKAAQFAAAIELARRALQEELKRSAALTSPGAVRDYLRLSLGRREEEVFVCSGSMRSTG